MDRRSLRCLDQYDHRGRFGPDGGGPSVVTDRRALDGPTSTQRTAAGPARVTVPQNRLHGARIRPRARPGSPPVATMHTRAG